MTTDNAREAMAVWLDASLVPGLLVRDGEAGFLAGYAAAAAAVAAERERCAKAVREAIFATPGRQRLSADILVRATDAAIGA